MTRVLFDAGGEAAGPGDPVTLDARRSHHLVRVLRLRAGESVEAFDGAGNLFAATVAEADPKRSVLRLGDRLSRETESPLSITLAQCLSSAERMDWTIEKAVELGVAAIVPLASARSVVRLDADRAARRHAHWQRIIVAACAQSGRSRLPALAPVTPLAGWLRAGLPGARNWMLDPTAATSLRDLALRATADATTACAILCGPESGFADDEHAAAVAAGWVPARLGPRVLRTETAGLAALAALQVLGGDLK